MNLVAPRHSHPKIVAHSQFNQLINQLLNPPNQFIPNNSSQLSPLPYTSSTTNSHSSFDMLSTNEYPVATSRGIKQLIYLDTQKQQQFKKAPVKSPLPPHPSSQYTNTSIHVSDTSTIDPSPHFPITEIQVCKPTPHHINQTPINNPLHHQQGVWTRDRIQ